MGPNADTILIGKVGSTKYTFHLRNSIRYRIFEIEPPETSVNKDPTLSAVYVPVTVTINSVDQFDHYPESDRLSDRNIEYMMHRMRHDADIENIISTFFPDYELSAHQDARSRAHFVNEFDSDDILFFMYLSRSQQHILMICALLIYTRLYLKNTIILLFCPFAMLDAFNKSNLWKFLKDQCQKYNIQMIISETSIPDNVIVNPLSIVNLNEQVPYYVLKKNTPKDLLEDILDLMTINELVIFGENRRVILFENKKLRRLLQSVGDCPLLCYSLVICDSDLHYVITKLHSITKYMKHHGSERKLQLLVVSDQRQEQDYRDLDIEVEWHCILTESKMEECIPKLTSFIYFEEVIQ
jgi:hypothetical protein